MQLSSRCCKAVDGALFTYYTRVHFVEGFGGTINKSSRWGLYQNHQSSDGMWSKAFLGRFHTWGENFDTTVIG